jgi:hypothetical protein
MKRFIGIVLLLSLVTFCAFNQPRYDEKHFVTQLIDNGQAVQIIEYLGTSESVRIPQKINNMPVNEIGSDAFSFNDLTNVTIPGSVTRIGESAFYGNELTNITIPGSVTSIGPGAFASNKLVSVTIPGSVVVIEETSFMGNELNSVEIQNGITTIGGYAFSENQIVSVTIPNSVTVIGECAFSENQIVSLTIPGSVVLIEEGAFADNRLTTCITIPDSVKSIGAGAFCMNDIAKLTIPKGISVIEKGVFAANSLASVTIPNNVTAIGELAFAYNEALTRISIGQNVTVAQDAFENGFADYYAANGSKAGTYILDGGSWRPESGLGDWQASANPKKLKAVMGRLASLPLTLVSMLVTETLPPFGKKVMVYILSLSIYGFAQYHAIYTSLYKNPRLAVTPQYPLPGYPCIRGWPD